MKKIKQLKLMLLACAVLFLSGCATLTYVGDDYNANNTQTIKTNEDLVFNVYKKTNQDVNVKMGISKTPVPEILALYIQVENLSYETPYIFKVEDLNISNPDRELQFITTSNYLNIYQTQEASSMAAMSSMGATLTNMTGMTSNYNEFNQSMVQNSSEQSNKSVFSNAVVNELNVGYESKIIETIKELFSVGVISRGNLSSDTLNLILDNGIFIYRYDDYLVEEKVLPRNRVFFLEDLRMELPSIVGAKYRNLNINHINTISHLVIICINIFYDSI